MTIWPGGVDFSLLWSTHITCGGGVGEGHVRRSFSGIGVRGFRHRVLQPFFDTRQFTRIDGLAKSRRNYKATPYNTLPSCLLTSADISLSIALL